MIDIQKQYPGLLEAMITVESGGNDNAVGDMNLKNKAYGCLQIRRPYVQDVNRVYKTDYKAEDCLGNRSLSIDILNKYMTIYATAKRIGHEPFYEDIARIHNGGPMGYRNSKTIMYWQKVQKLLNR